MHINFLPKNSFVSLIQNDIYQKRSCFSSIDKLEQCSVSTNASTESISCFQAIWNGIVNFFRCLFCYKNVSEKNSHTTQSVSVESKLLPEKDVDDSKTESREDDVIVKHSMDTSSVQSKQSPVEEVKKTVLVSKTELKNYKKPYTNVMQYDLFIDGEKTGGSIVFGNIPLITPIVLLEVIPIKQTQPDPTYYENLKLLLEKASEENPLICRMVSNKKNYLLLKKLGFEIIEMEEERNKKWFFLESKENIGAQLQYIGAIERGLSTLIIDTRSETQDFSDHPVVQETLRICIECGYYSNPLPFKSITTKELGELFRNWKKCLSERRKISFTSATVVKLAMISEGEETYLEKHSFPAQFWMGYRRAKD